MLRTCRLVVLLTLMAWTFSAGTAPAAELDKYLPDDTNGLISINLRQVIDSPLFKKSYLPLLQKELAAKPDLQKLLKDFGVDPFRDIDRLQVAFADSCERSGDSGEPGFCVIVRGRFDLAKVHTTLAALVPHLNNALKVHNAGNKTIYEVNGDGRSFFFGLPERTTLVFSPRREAVTIALGRATGNKPPVLTSKEVQDLIAKTDAKQAAWLVATGRTTLSFEPTFVAGKDGKKRKTLADSEVYEVTGGLAIADGVKGTFAVKLKTEIAAKAVSEALQNELAKAVDKGFDGALDDRRLAPVRAFLKDMVIAGDGRHIVIQSEVPGRAFNNIK